ncbi:MAG: hypothetical protein QM783_09025 [Phycisphaerales bacterium]
MTDPTLDPALRSWLPSANEPTTDFPIQNLPLGMFITKDDELKVGVAIGDHVVDLDMLVHSGVLNSVAEQNEELFDIVHHALHHAAPQIMLERRSPGRPSAAPSSSGSSTERPAASSLAACARRPSPP